jgi:signal peptidase I
MDRGDRRGGSARARWMRAVPIVLLVAVWWQVLGPVGLGGPATFVIVHGRSMEGTFDAGDLVLARSSSTYRVGDVVVFTPPGHHGHVLHRIVDGDAAVGWTTRGDANRRDDAWTVTGEMLMGRAWGRVPRLGAMLGGARARPATSVVTIIAVLALTMLLGSPAKLRSQGASERRSDASRTAAAVILCVGVVVGGLQGSASALAPPASFTLHVIPLVVDTRVVLTVIWGDGTP